MSTTLYALDLNSGALKTVPLTNLSALYKDTPTDTLLAAVGAAAVSMFTATGRATGTWKKRVLLENYETFTWAALDSDFLDANGSSAVTAALTIADAAGTTLASLTISDRTPVRLPPFKEKELIVTVASKARITALHMASSSAELKQL